MDRAERGKAVPFEFESDTRKIMDGREGSIWYFGRLSQKFYVYTTFPREDVKRKGKRRESAREGGEDSAPDEKRRGETGVEDRIRE